MEGDGSGDGEQGDLPPSMAEMRGSETVLLAEDHESVREMARQTLVGLGYRVLSAGDGEEALRLCEARKARAGDSRCHHAEARGPGGGGKLSKRFADLRVLFTSGYSAESEVIPERRETAISAETVQPHDAGSPGTADSRRAGSRGGIRARFGVVRTRETHVLRVRGILHLYHQAGWSQALASRDKSRRRRSGPTLEEAELGGHSTCLSFARNAARIPGNKSAE